MLLRNEKLTPKKTITPFKCDKSNELQEYKYCIFNKRTSPINEKKNYPEKNTNNQQPTINNHFISIPSSHILPHHSSHTTNK